MQIITQTKTHRLIASKLKFKVQIKYFKFWWKTIYTGSNLKDAKKFYKLIR